MLGVAEATDSAAIEEIQAAKCMESCITECENAPLVTMCCMASYTTGATLVASYFLGSITEKNVHDL